MSYSPYNPFSTIPPQPFTAVGPIYGMVPSYGGVYYNVPEEFANPFQYWLRWANYAWAYQPPTISTVVLPP